MTKIIKTLIKSLAFSAFKLQVAISKPLDVIQTLTTIRKLLSWMNPDYSSFKINLLMTKNILLNIYIVIWYTIIFTPINLLVYIMNLYYKYTNREEYILKPCYLLELKPGYSFKNNFLLNLLNSFKGEIGEDNYYTILEEIDVMNMYDSNDRKYMEECKKDPYIINNIILKTILFIVVMWVTYKLYNNHLDFLTNNILSSSPFITFFNKVKSTISKEKGDQFKHWLNNLLNTDYKDRKLTGEDIRIIHRRSTIYLMENNPDLKDSNLLTVSDFLKNNNLLSDSCKEEDGFVNLPDSPTLQKIVELNKNLVDVASSNSMLTNGKGRIESFGNNTLLKDLDVVFDINNKPTILLNDKPLQDNKLTTIVEELSKNKATSSIGTPYSPGIKDLEIENLLNDKLINRASSMNFDLDIIDPSIFNLADFDYTSNVYRKLKELFDLPPTPKDTPIKDVVNTISLPTSPITPNIWDNDNSSESDNETTYPTSSRNTIDSIISALNKPEPLNFNDKTKVGLIEPISNNSKPLLNDDDMNKLVKALKEKGLKSSLFFLIPFTNLKLLKSKLNSLKILINNFIQNIKINKIKIFHTILRSLIVRLILYVVLLILYKITPYLLPIFDFSIFNGLTDSSIISMSVEEYEQWINTLSDSSLPSYEESIYNKPLPDVPQTNIILNIINEIIDWWK